MKPYLVNSVVQNGKIVKSFQPVVMVDSICSQKTLEQLHTSLVGVVNNGTAKSLQSPFFQLAGKTGTAQVANGNRGYTDHIYQASFAGFFPADNPKYSCIVVIKNKPFAAKYYGALVAGPVFKEVATKLFTIDPELYASYAHKKFADTSKSVWVGSQKDFSTISGQLNQKAYSGNTNSEWTKMHVQNKNIQSESITISRNTMPDVIGFGLKDALDVLERQSLQVIAQGKGKVSQQSIVPGAPIQKGQTIYLTLGKMIE
jgi:cell division protein FtsI (penicillin-binding protein 3)